MLGPAFYEGQFHSYILWKVLHEFKTHYWLIAGEREQRGENAQSVLTIFKPVAFQPTPHRPWAFPCRSLCGLDLHRPHLTCFAFCRLRKTWTKQLQNPVAIEGIHLLWLDDHGQRVPYNLIILAHRRLRVVKEILLNGLLPFCERLPNLPQRKMLLTICEVLAN